MYDFRLPFLVILYLSLNSEKVIVERRCFACGDYIPLDQFTDHPLACRVTGSNRNYLGSSSNEENRKRKRDESEPDAEFLRSLFAETEGNNTQNDVLRTVDNNITEEREMEEDGAQNNEQNNEGIENLPNLRRLDEREFFQCPKCPNISPSYRQHVTHLWRAHKTPAPTCKFCDRKFVTESILKKHERWHAYPNKMRCDKCFLVFETLEEFDEHMGEQQHPDLPRRQNPEPW